MLILGKGACKREHSLALGCLGGASPVGSVSSWCKHRACGSVDSIRFAKVRSGLTIDVSARSVPHLY